MANPLSELRVYLSRLPAGRIGDTGPVIALLSDCWDDLPGAGTAATSAEKLWRAEKVEWNPPQLTFVLERHGGTVAGSTRADLHRWTIDLDRAQASCETSYSYRQVHSRDAPLRIEPLIDEIVDHVTGGLESPKLKWFSDRSAVRVLVGEFITGRFKQTQVGRRKRFRAALDSRLWAEGWTKIPGKLDSYRRAD